MRQSARRPVLSLNTFEDRATPAVVVGYSLGTLTLSARTGDNLTVSPETSDIPGQLTISDGTKVVYSSTANNGRPVHNLVINGGQASNYFLGFGDNVVLNNLTVNGGTASTGVILGETTRIARAFRFNGSTTGGNDSIQFDPGSRIGGGAIINMRGGSNGLFLDGGYVGGNVLVTSGGGTDTVELAAAGDLTIGGTLSLSLGNGANNVLGASTFAAAIGWNFLYAGGADDDRIDFQTNATPLTVAGTIDLAFGSASNVMNDWVSGPLFVGGDFLVTGGIGRDEIGLFGDTEINGALIANMGDWTNQLFLGFEGTGVTTIGGDLGYSGGVGFDAVYVDNTAVGGNAVLNLGAGGGENQFVLFGTRQGAGILIDGSLAISTGAENDDVRIYGTTVSTTTTIATGGGDDLVFLDDVDLIGAVNVNLGAGNDQFEVENGVDNQHETNPVPLTGIARFGDGITVNGGAGADAMTMRGPDGEQIRAAGAVRLIGGTGIDTLTLPGDAGDVYLGPVSEDLELGSNF